MFLDLKGCVLCVYLEKFAFLFLTDIFVCNVAKYLPSCVKCKMNESFLSRTDCCRKWRLKRMQHSRGVLSEQAELADNC